MTMTDRTQLILSSVRNYEFIKKAVDTINENLYSSDLWVNDRIQMDVEQDEDGNMSRFIITGTALDFFQIGLRYGGLEETARIKKIQDIMATHY
jgi:hypothetical protein